MRVLYLFVAAILATAGSAQTIPDDVAALPSCATGCLYPAIAEAGCGETDWTCICGSAKATIRTNAFSCIISACSTPDALKTQQLAADICSLNAASNSSSSVASGSTSGQPAATPSAPSTFTSSSSTSSSFSTTFTSTIVLLSTVPPLASSTSKASPQLLPKTGLSKGAIVGIALGAILGGLFLILLLALFVFGYRKRQRDLKHLAAMAVVEDKPVPMTGPYELSGSSHMNELSSTREVPDIEAEETGTLVGANERAEGESKG